MAIILPFERITPSDRAAVGGKGLQLAKLVRAGLPVPPGFCITAESLVMLDDPAVRHAIIEAYRALGSGPVAVRSSAVVEDSAVFSFAGQFETSLPVEGDSEVLAAIANCFASRDSERVRAYQRQAGISATPAMAVVVQRYVPSEISGVLFTRDPADDTAVLIEAVRGQGTAVVSGQVNPERIRVDRTSGSIRGESGTLLYQQQLRELSDLGSRIESLLECSCDVEWTWSVGQFWILQARPITTAHAAEREAIVHEEIEHARRLADPDGTIWVRQSLAEVLPHPTPMTWALMQRMLSGEGGLGQMYRDFGCAPDPALATIGVYDLIAGGPYLNLSREPRMQYGDMPLRRPFAAIKQHPTNAIDFEMTLSYDRMKPRSIFRLPAILWKLWRMKRTIAGHARRFDSEFRSIHLPAFLTECAVEARIDYRALTVSALLARFECWAKSLLVEFARHSLKPGALAGAALAGLRARCRRGGDADEDFATAAAEWTRLAWPGTEVDLLAALHGLSTGAMDHQSFVERFGHRGPNEMELSAPRWCETGPPTRSEEVPLRGRAQIESHFAPHGGVPRWTRSLRTWEGQALTYLALRETAKHYFLLGYFQLRRMLLELDRRFNLQGGIFFLTPDELPRLASGDDLSITIAARRRRWAVLKSVPAPAVLFSDELGAIGRAPAALPFETRIQGIALSAGIAEGRALVLSEPIHVDSSEQYVLVCASCDPAWTPIFARACAVVMETGGILSHGAIVAREFGLPAVGAVLDATRRIRPGQRLRVDGGAGVVTVRDAL